MKNKKKEMLLIGLGIVSILVIIVGVTYAFFNYTKQGSTNNVIETGTIKFLYDEKYGYGNGIQIIDAVPMSDELGKKQKGDNQVFDFKIVSTTMSNTSIPYTITVKKYDSDLDDKFVKLYLTKVEGANEEELVLSKFNGEEGENYLDSYKGSTVERILYKGNVPSGKTDYEINYRLRMWIDEDVDFSPDVDANGNSISSESPYNGQSFKIRVNVYANGASLDEEGLANESKAEIKTLSLGGEEITPSATNDKLYEATLPEGTSSATVDIETESEYASVKIEKTDSNYNSLTSMNTGTIERMSTKRTLPLTGGDNYFKITVTSEDRVSKTEVYKLHIKISKSIRIFGKAYEIASDTPSLTTKYDGVGKLYESTKTNNGDPTYYFRGAVTNNWVSFAGFKWRIVRINEDGSIRMIMQDGINKNGTSTPTYKYNQIFKGSSIVYYQNWTNSSGYAKYELNKWFTEKIESVPNYLNKLATGTNYFCQHAKVKYASDISTSDLTMYNEYIPSFYCDQDAYGYDYVPNNPKVGLLTYDELVFAGGYYYTAGNGNNYLMNGTSWWTMSPNGTYCDYLSIWIMSKNGFITYDNEGYSAVRPVINLNANTTITKGTGIESDPFLITDSPEITS